MAESRSFQLNCACGHEFETILWDSINVTENKGLKSQLLNGEINIIQCPKCKKKSYIEKELLYHDMDLKLWILMYPQMDRPKWPSLEDEMGQKLQQKLKLDAYAFRMVFGRDELVEKVRIFDSGLDDRVIELLKLRVVQEDESLKDAHDVRIAFSRYIPEDAEIQLHVYSQQNNVSQTVIVSFDHYVEIEESQEHL